MKLRNLLKIIVAILIAVTLIVTFTGNAYATRIDLDQFKNGDKSNATKATGTLIGKVINALQVIGAGFAIVMLVATGIRWVSAAPSGKAQIKKESIYYILGAFFIFTAIGLVQIVQHFIRTANSQV